jgi:DNA-binding beta-propeller fold protein YncE
MKDLFRLFSASALASIAWGGTIFLGGYPDSILVVDEGQGKVVDKIHLGTGLPMSMRLSDDKKQIFVTTNDHSGIEVIDVASRKVLSHFVLNTATKHYRFNGGTPDPQGKLFYTVTTEIDKQPEHYDIGKPKYTVVDLEQQKIAKTVDVAPEDENGAVGGYGRNIFEISADGKFLYQFRDKVVILNSDDFKVVDRIDLSKPDQPGMENVGFGARLDSIGEPGKHISLFNSADPIVHNRVFGIARFDLTTRDVNFDPIGPAPAGMAGLQVTPDMKSAYTIVANGTHGNKRCEFWSFDLSTDHITKTAEVPCRTRFSFGMSSDGKKLYIYGAGYEIEVYDAATLKYERTWDLANDVTGAGMIVSTN